MDTKKKKIAIIGAGISGVKAAFDILEQAAPSTIESVTLFEAGEKRGGALKHVDHSGYHLELGAQGILPQRESIQTCLKETGQENKLVFSQTKNNRYLIINSQIVPLSLLVLYKLNVLKLGDILRIFAEFFISHPKNKRTQETLYDFFSRHFGERFTDVILIPLSFGIWGGGAKTILLRHAFKTLLSLEERYGSLLRGLLFTKMKKLFGKKEPPMRLASLQGGMNSFVENIYAGAEEKAREKNIALHCHTGKQIKKINFSQEKFQLLLEDETLFSSDILIYTGSFKNAKTLFDFPHPIAQKALEQLFATPSHSLVSVGIGGIPSAKTPHFDGFGAVNNTSTQDMLGILFIHSLFPQHVPKDRFLYRVILGGEAHPNLIEQNEDEILSLVKKRLQECHLLTGEEVIEFTHVAKWQDFIALPDGSHDARLVDLWRLEALYPGLFFCGNSILGVGVEDCLKSAAKAAQKVGAFLQQERAPL